MRGTVLRDEKMKHITNLLAALLTFTGCATFKTQPRTFDQAVLQSIQADHEHQPVVIVVNRTGALTVGGRPTTLEEIEGIREVAVLPVNPPAVLIRLHRETMYDDVRRVLNALTNAGVWQIFIPSQQ